MVINGVGNEEDKSHQAMTHQSGGWVSHLSEILSSLAAHWYHAAPNTVRFLKMGSNSSLQVQKNIYTDDVTNKTNVLFCGFCVM